MAPTNLVLGLPLSLMAGILLGAFALPMKKVKIWQWEQTWVMFSLWGTVIFPLILATLTVPALFSTFTGVPLAVIVVVFLFGAGWGVANVAFGIGLKMVGLALGTAIMLGLNNAIGAILPIILFHPDQLLKPVGMTISAGVLVMIAGIVVCSIAGMKREKLNQYDQKDNSVNRKSNTFMKGFFVCLISGIFGAMFNFALIKGKPLELVAISHGATPLNAANPTWVIALGGGFIVTLIYCLYLFKSNRSSGLLFSKGSGINWIFTLLMGLAWYGGVALYGMSVSRLGIYGASIGWPIIQSMAIGTGNLLGIITGEWKGSGKLPFRLMLAGLGLLFLGIIIIGFAATIS